MLQLNHSQATNTNAVYPDVLAPVGTTQVLLDFTQSINKNTTPNIIATLANTVSAANPWLVIQLTGSSVPTASGQYNVDIYTFTQGGTLGIWGTQATLWNLALIKLQKKWIRPFSYLHDEENPFETNPHFLMDHIQ